VFNVQVAASYLQTLKWYLPARPMVKFKTGRDEFPSDIIAAEMNEVNN
jgi:hypothetical protein